MARPSYYRVIHHLADGRKKYSTHRGVIEQWTSAEVEMLRDNIYNYGGGAYLRDFSRYGTDWRELKGRYPEAEIIRIIDCTVELHNQPIDNDIIF